MIMGQNSFFSKDSIEMAFGSSKITKQSAPIEPESTEESANDIPSDSPQ
jgi:hypothetical protein